MNKLLVCTVLVCLALLPAAAWAQQATTAPACSDDACTVAAPTSAPASQPASAPTLVAIVGQRKIMSDEIDKPLANLPAGIPAEMVANFRQRVLAEIISRELIHCYLAAQKIEVTDKDMAAIMERVAKVAESNQMSVDEFMAKQGVTKDMLTDQVRIQKLVESATAKDKVAAFIAAHPSYFDGSKVQASHVLIKFDPATPSVQQKEALEKIKGIAADIKAGKISFEDAARKYSACSSGQKGGDLGEFSFDKMTPPFAMAAFDLPEGQMSDVVRTSFGYHIIKTTKRIAASPKAATQPTTSATQPATEPAEEPQAAPEEIAANAIMAELQNQVFEQALTTCPIEIK